MNNMRVGIIGMGNMGSAHANCVIKGEVAGMQLVAVCDIDVGRTEAFVAARPTVATYTNYCDLFEHPQLDAVIIAVPHPLHAMIAGEALKRGLHVLLEKPIDIAVSKARELVETARSSGKVFAIMFNQRTNTLFQRAHEIVSSGALGELKRTVWIITNWYRTQHYYDSGGWRATWAGEGGGVLINQAPHNLDLWQWICGMPQSVTAFCNVAQHHHIEVEDDATILTRYANGATGVFVTSTGEYPGTNRLEISGDRGKLVLEGGVLKWWKLSTSVAEVSETAASSFASIACEYQEIQPTGPETAHKGILQNFVNAVLYGEELISPGSDGIHELILSNAAYLSEWTGNREVMLPLDTALFDEMLGQRAATSSYHATQQNFHLAEDYKTRWQVNW